MSEIKDEPQSNDPPFRTLSPEDEEKLASLGKALGRLLEEDRKKGNPPGVIFLGARDLEKLPIKE